MKSPAMSHATTIVAGYIVRLLIGCKLKQAQIDAQF